ncbi:MAG: hypothetical protein LBQ88_11440 [Treponema sp.]|jgi:hypothetical protein|nr:hypothetical protein [Treponema sp.]
MDNIIHQSLNETWKVAVIRQERLKKMKLPETCEAVAAAGLKNGENELVVHLLPVCVEARKNKVSAGNNHLKYNYECLRLRKSHTAGCPG